MSLTRQEWADRIRGKMAKTVEAIIETGRELIAAKEDIAHGGFEAMVREDLEMSPRTVERLMALGRDERLSNPTHVSFLPPSWGTLYELSRLTDDQWAHAVDRGAIHPEMRRADVVAIRNPEPVEAAADFSGCAITDLEDAIGKVEFGTIYADPPWQYGNQATRAATDNHYQTMTIDDLCALPVDALAAESALLHLWTTNAFIFDARRVMEAWGFEYKSCFVWVKPQMGIGNYWRVSHEFMLLGSRGGQRFTDKSLMSWAELRRGQHSAKPAPVRAMVEKAGPGPYLELFGRSEAPGWTVWGNEVQRDLFVSGLAKP